MVLLVQCVPHPCYCIVILPDHQSVGLAVYIGTGDLLSCFVAMVTSGIAKGRPGWACAHPTHIKCLPKSLVCPVTWIKRSVYSNKTVKHSIKTVSSSIVPTHRAHNKKFKV